MLRPAKTLLFGVTTPGEALDAGLLGVDGVVVQLGGPGPCAVDAATAAAIARALPPLAARLCWLPDAGDDAAGGAEQGESRRDARGAGSGDERGEGPAEGRGAITLPAGYHGAVTPAGVHCPARAGIHVVRVDPGVPLDLPFEPTARALWIPPRPSGSSSATRFDFAAISRLSTKIAPILEVPDGADGVETAIRLGRPYAVVFADAVWFRPGIVDLDALERALGVVARLNKSAYDA